MEGYAFEQFAVSDDGNFDSIKSIPRTVLIIASRILSYVVAICDL